MAFAAPVALALGIAGAGVQAYGAIRSGEAASEAAAYRAQVAQNNATIAEQRATRAIQVGQREAATTSMRGAAREGRLRTTIAAGGVDVNTGSAADVQASEREAAALDSATVLNNAELAAYGYRSEGANFRANADLEEAAGENAQAAGYINAAGGLLSSASSLAGNYGRTFGGGSGGSGGGMGLRLNTTGSLY